MSKFKHYNLVPASVKMFQPNYPRSNMINRQLPNTAQRPRAMQYVNTPRSIRSNILPPLLPTRPVEAMPMPNSKRLEQAVRFQPTVATATNSLPPPRISMQQPPTSTSKTASVFAKENPIMKSNASNEGLNVRYNEETATNNTANYRIFGSTENEKIFIFTGTVERVIKWNKIFQNHFCYYEVIASVISIQEGSVNTQKIMLLRDKKGPILQVVYYVNTHIDIQDFHVDQVLRCVGRMSSPNILNAISIRTATQEETETLQRLCLVCDHAVSHFLSV